MSSGVKVVKVASFLMIAMILSRILGYIREAVLASSFGMKWETDAFLAAFTVPDLLYDLLVGGVISSAFIPIFSSYLSTDKEEEAWEVASTIINLTLIVMSIFIVLGMFFTVPLTKLIAYNFSGEPLELTVKLTRIMFPAFIVLALNGLIQGILNSYGHFAAPAIGAIAYNFCIIVIGLLLSQKYNYGIAAFAVGVLIGHVANFLIKPPMLIKKIHKYYKFSINLKHPGVKKFFILVMPTILGLAANRVNLIVNQSFASGISEGSITALRLANRLMWLPLGVFAGSIAVALFPTMTSQAATDKMDDFKKTLSMGVRSIFLVTIPASVGLGVLSIPIVRLLFERNQFDANATKVTAYALIFYCLGLFAQAAIWVIIRSFYALHDTVRPLLIAVSTIVINILLNFLFKPILQERGLALAYSLTGIYNMVVLFIVLRLKIGKIGLSKIITSFIKITVSSGVMGVSVYLVSQLLGNYVNINLTFNQIFQVAVSILIGLVVFVVAILFCKLEEVDLATGIIKKKFRKITKDSTFS